MSTKMVVLGKVSELPVIEEFRGKKEYKIVVDVRRNFQQPDGKFNSDKMAVYLWRGMAEYICDVLEIGEDIHIIGRFENDDNNNIILFGEQVDLLR